MKDPKYNPHKDKKPKGKGIYFRPSPELENAIRDEAEKKYEGHLSMAINNRLNASYFGGDAEPVNDFEVGNLVSTTKGSRYKRKAGGFSQDEPLLIGEILEIKGRKAKIAKWYGGTGCYFIENLVMASAKHGKLPKD